LRWVMVSPHRGLGVGHNRHSCGRDQPVPEEQAARRRQVRLLQKYLLNPPVKLGVYLGLIPGYALVETVGRRTGKRRHTVVGVHIEDNAAWIVAEQGRHWHTGQAQIIPDDDPQQRLDRFGRPSHAAAVRRFGTNLLTIKIDLQRSP
jgi:hypothetical protein